MWLFGNCFLHDLFFIILHSYITTLFHFACLLIPLGSFIARLHYITFLTFQIFVQLGSRICTALPLLILWFHLGILTFRLHALHTLTLHFYWILNSNASTVKFVSLLLTWKWNLQMHQGAKQDSYSTVFYSSRTLLTFQQSIVNENISNFVLYECLDISCKKYYFFSMLYCKNKIFKCIQGGNLDASITTSHSCSATLQALR